MSHMKYIFNTYIDCVFGIQFHIDWLYLNCKSCAKKMQINLPWVFPTTITQNTSEMLRGNKKFAKITSMTGNVIGKHVLTVTFAPTYEK